MSDPTASTPDPQRQRHESDREDIMREATALTRRISLGVDGQPEPIVAGFRRNGFFAVYFDQDPVYQFDDSGRLRRAYRGGLLYRTQGHTLAELNRVRTETRTVLERSDLNAPRLAEFLAEMCRHIDSLRRAMMGGAARVIAAEPDRETVFTAVVDSLESVLNAEAALAPALPTRRT